MKRLLLILAATVMTVLLCCSASADVIEEIPTLSELYREMPVHLRTFSDESQRVTSFAGPDNTYMSAGSYKPYKQEQISGLFIENGYMLIHLRYQTVEERYLYIKESSFDDKSNTPVISELTEWEGAAAYTVQPVWGPGREYQGISEKSISEGTYMTVFFRENGYFFAECADGTDIFRAWYPEDAIILKENEAE
ncbi:MAG: hypothetical protein Q4G19_00255 [Clostridia bacterium]|nr:hypothetical protein [Clostridia bacterium]